MLGVNILSSIFLNHEQETFLKLSLKVIQRQHYFFVVREVLGYKFIKSIKDYNLR